MEVIGQVVATVAIIDLTGADIQDSAKKSHEHAGFVIAADLGVQAHEDFTGSSAVPSGGFEKGLGHGHKEGRWDCVDCDIDCYDAKVGVIEIDKIVEVL